MVSTRSSAGRLVKPLRVADIVDDALSTVTPSSHEDSASAADVRSAAIRVRNIEVQLARDAPDFPLLFAEGAVALADLHALLEPGEDNALGNAVEAVKQRLSEEKPEWFLVPPRLVLKTREIAQPTAVYSGIDEDRYRDLQDQLNDLRSAMAKPEDVSAVVQALHVLKGTDVDDHMPVPLDMTNPAVALSPLVAVAFLWDRRVRKEQLETPLSRKVLLSPLGRELVTAVTDAMNPDGRVVACGTAVREEIRLYVRKLCGLYRARLREIDTLSMADFVELHAEEVEEASTLARSLVEDYCTRVKSKKAALELRSATLLTKHRMPAELSEAVAIVNKRGRDAKDSEPEHSDTKRGQRQRRRRQHQRQERRQEDASRSKPQNK